MTAREAKAWRTAMQEHDVDIGALESTLDAACRQPDIAADDEISLAEIALQHSADMFTAGKLSLAIAYGREARALADSLRKELELAPDVVHGRVVRAARAKGAPALATVNERRKVETTARDDALWKRYRLLTATGDRDRADAVSVMVKENRYGSRATIQRVVKSKLAKKCDEKSTT